MPAWLQRLAMRLTRKQDKGFILVAVIWLAGLIAAAATGFAIKVRMDTLQAAAAIRSAEAELAADGLVRLTAFRLAAGREINADSSASLCSWKKGVQARIAVQEQAGLIDLNQVPDTVFTEMLKRLGVADKQARTLSQNFQDYRDADDEAQQGGKEPELYAARNYGPKNAPFQAIEELDQIPGLDDAVYRAMLPLVTVYSTEMPGVSPQTAPKALRQLFGEAPSGDFKGILKSFSGAAQRKTFGIDVNVEVATGARFRRQAIAVLLRQPDQPFVILEWKKASPLQDPLPVSNTACFN